jgi:hypothetical protein
MAADNDRSRLAKPVDVADYVGTTVAHLANLRWSGKGPAWPLFGLVRDT